MDQNKKIKTKRVVTEIDEKLWARLRIKLVKDKITLSDLVRSKISEYVYGKSEKEIDLLESPGERQQKASDDNSCEG